MNKVIEFTPRSSSRAFIIAGFLITAIAVSFIISSDSLKSGQSIFGYFFALISFLYLSFAIFLRRKSKSKSFEMGGNKKAISKKHISPAA